MSKPTIPEGPPGGAPHSLPPPTQKHVSWELWFASLLFVAISARDARLAYFEAEDRRKAQEIDRLRRAGGERRHAA
jgi:hypothetical protein